MSRSDAHNPSLHDQTWGLQQYSCARACTYLALLHAARIFCSTLRLSSRPTKNHMRVYICIPTRLFSTRNTHVFHVEKKRSHLSDNKTRSCLPCLALLRLCYEKRSHPRRNPMVFVLPCLAFATRITLTRQQTRWCCLALPPSTFARVTYVRTCRVRFEWRWYCPRTCGAGKVVSGRRSATGIYTGCRRPAGEPVRPRVCQPRRVPSVP